MTGSSPKRTGAVQLTTCSHGRFFILFLVIHICASYYGLAPVIVGEEQESMWMAECRGRVAVGFLRDQNKHGYRQFRHESRIFVISIVGMQFT